MAVEAIECPLNSDLVLFAFEDSTICVFNLTTKQVLDCVRIVLLNYTMLDAIL